MKEYSDDDLLFFTGIMWNEPLITVAAELLQARQRIRELEEQQRWIPVSKRLPEKDTTKQWEMYECLLDRHGDILVAPLWFENGLWLSQSRTDYSDYVTHWRPLPQPPEEE